MVSKIVKVINAEGMHMRPAGIITKAAKSHPESEIIMKANSKDIKATAVMQIMSAGIKCGDKIEIIAEGENEQAALDKAEELFLNGFGE